MHAGIFEPLERSLGLGGEVGQEAASSVGDRHGAHAVAHHVHLARQRRVLGHDLVEEVVDGALDAVACSLAHEDHVIGLEQGVDEVRVLLTDGPAIVRSFHLGSEHRVVLGEGVHALDLGHHLGGAGEGVELDGLLEYAAESVADAAELAVERPDVQRVLAGIVQLLAVVLHVLDQPRVVAVGQEGRRRIGHVAASDHIGHLDDRVLGRMLTFRVQPEAGEEDHQRHVGVERRRDVGDEGGVAVDELRRTHAVLDGSPPAAAAHVERAVRMGEVALTVDQTQHDLPDVGGGGLDLVLLGPVLAGFEQGRGVGGVTPHLGVAGVEVPRDG